jgi:dTDP-4-dehydrorhamnose 3,5-epimerase
MNKKFTSRKIRDCNFDGVKFIEQDAYQDHRGYYYTVYDNTIDSKNNYVRDKISSSSKNVLRGIHGDYKTTKLITCVHGEVYCVIVDNREDSETFAEWSWEILSLHNRNILVLPPGVGLSYLILSESANILYKWAYDGDYPDIDEQFTLKWDDPILDIFWPIDKPILQPRDS